MLTFTTSFRRYYLDFHLNNTQFVGSVLDIGGKKNNKRGSFRPPTTHITSWKYLNVDASTNPDYKCSAEDIPIQNQLIDTVLLCEVLEHLENPQAVLKEICRVLKKDGTLIASIPFLFPIHADPFDFRRWTKIKLMSELKNAGFNHIHINHMGGPFAVIHDILRFNFNNKLMRIFLKIIRPVIFLLEKQFNPDHTCTGYFIKASK